MEKYLETWRMMTPLSLPSPPKTKKRSIFEAYQNQKGDEKTEQYLDQDAFTRVTVARPIEPYTPKPLSNNWNWGHHTRLIKYYF